MPGRSALLEITALEPLIMTSEPATEGAPATLDYIPGAILLGLAAQSSYDTMGDPFRVFHSGAVRFGCGLPLSPRDGAAGTPAPFSLHVEKPGKFTKDGGALTAEVTDLSADKRKTETLYQQFRGGWITRERRRFDIEIDGGLKTAIEFKTGMAAESQLYGYAAIRAGARFLARLEDDGAVEGAAEADFEQALAALLGKRRIGRSRRTEFGKVEITLREGRDPLAEALVSGAPRDGYIALYAITDIHLPNDPITGELDLLLGDAATTVAAHTFARARRYSPFNGAWKRRGVERTVLAAGSVIAVKNADPAKLAAALSHGWGLDRELGLGRVAQDPKLLTGPVGGPIAELVEAPATQVTPTPFFTALKARAARGAAVGAAEAEADELLSGLEALYRGAARLAASKAGSIGPSKSQWGEIEQALKEIGWRGEVNKILGDTEDRKRDADWTALTGTGTDFAGWLNHALNGGPPSEALTITVKRARAMLERLALEDDQGGTGR